MHQIDIEDAKGDRQRLKEIDTDQLFDEAERIAVNQHVRRSKIGKGRKSN